jgi:hypothetical protein
VALKAVINGVAKTENKRHTAVTANTPAMNQLAQWLTLDKPSGNGSSGV